VKFEFEKYVGPKPLFFGMKSDQVMSVLGKSPDHSRPAGEFGGAREDYSDIGVNYDEDGNAAEFCFGPSEDFELLVSGKVVIGKGGVSNPVKLFRKLDESPKEVVGFLVFLKLGVNTTGYHDNDQSQRAINVFKKGYWDAQIV